MVVTRSAGAISTILMMFVQVGLLTPEPSDTWVGAGGGVGEQRSRMRLGASLFWGLGGLKHGRPELQQQLREYADANVDFVRTLIHLNSTDPRNPWKDIGLHAEDPELEEQLKRYLDLVSSYGMKVEFTLLGGMADMARADQQDRFVDRVSNAIRSRLGTIELLEVMNEYGVNGGSIPVLHRMAKRLRANLGDGFVLALSSPNAVHQGGSTAEIQAEVKAMHLQEANAITPHWDRSLNKPPDLGGYAPALVICGEPRGPRSSGRGTDNPADIEHDWKAAEAAGYYAYVLHSDSGVWSTYISDLGNDGTRGKWPVFSTHSNGPSILETVKRLRGGSGAGGGPKRVGLYGLTSYREDPAPKIEVMSSGGADPVRAPAVHSNADRPIARTSKRRTNLL